MQTGKLAKLQTVAKNTVAKKSNNLELATSGLGEGLF